MSTGDKLHERTEAISRRRADNMETSYGCFQTSVQYRKSIYSSDLLHQFGGHEVIFGDINMETCAQQDVIHNALPTIAKLDANAITNWSDRSDGAVQRDRNIPKPTHQPTRARGPNSPASELILQRPRQHPD